MLKRTMAASEREGDHRPQSTTTITEDVRPSKAALDIGPACWVIVKRRAQRDSGDSEEGVLPLLRYR